MFESSREGCHGGIVRCIASCWSLYPTVDVSEALAGFEILHLFTHILLKSTPLFHAPTLVSSILLNHIYIPLESIRDCLSLLFPHLRSRRASIRPGRITRGLSLQDVCRSLLHSPILGKSSSRRYAQASPMILSFPYALCTRGRPITLDGFSLRSALFNIWLLHLGFRKDSLMEWPTPTGSFNMSDRTR